MKKCGCCKKLLDKERNFTCKVTGKVYRNCIACRRRSTQYKNNAGSDDYINSIVKSVESLESKMMWV